jgi:hypothetical protein
MGLIADNFEFSKWNSLCLTVKTERYPVTPSREVCNEQRQNENGSQSTENIQTNLSLLHQIDSFRMLYLSG